MNDKQLRSFIEIVECGSFSKAENILFLSKQALKKQMDTLEREVGVTLLERSTQGVFPTEAGKEFLIGAKQLLGMIDYEVKRSRAAAGKNTLRIGVLPDLLDAIIVKTVPSFIKKYPEIEINLVEMPNQKWLEAVKNGELSACLFAASSEIGRRGLCFSPIANQPVYCMFNHTNPLCVKDEITLQDLKGQKIYVGGKDWYSQIIDSINKSGVGIRMVEIPYTFSNILRSCLYDGVVILSKWRVDHFAPMIARPLRIDAEFSYGFAYRESDSIEVEKFIAVAREVYANPLISTLHVGA